MVRHMVMWQLKPEAAEPEAVFAQNLAAMRERFEQMKQELQYIRNVAVHESFKRGSGFYDFVVIIDFASREDLERFQDSPTHRDPAAMEFCMQIRQQKAVVDYEF